MQCKKIIRRGTGLIHNATQKKTYAWLCVNRKHRNIEIKKKKSDLALLAQTYNSLILIVRYLSPHKKLYVLK